MKGWLTTLRVLGDLALPRACPSCDATIDHDEGTWCRACRERLLHASAHGYCHRCGKSTGPYAAHTNGCAACRALYTPIDGLVRCGPYHGILGTLIRRFKYQRKQGMDRPMGDLLAGAIVGSPWHGHLDALVPVPTDWRSRLLYGFGPPTELAREATRNMNLPFLPVLKTRGKKCRQIELPASKRIQNVRGTFHLKAHARVQGTVLCIVDDVCTTGATLCECARVLRKGGAARIYAAVLARTSPHDLPGT